MTFQIQISNYVLGNLTDSDLPEIGLTGLEEGLESESLNILAGMNPNDNSFQLVDYFNKAIDELNILIPSKREAAIRVALHYTDLILLGKLDPVNGVQKIINYCLRNYNFYDETKNYVMDSINFEQLYGLYWTYDDLKESSHRWNKNKSNEELMIIVEKSIIEELKKWKEKTISCFNE